MNKLSGFARVLARARVEQQAHKPLIGKAFLRYGQCHAVWSYFNQLGAVLGALHRENPDAFGPAFLGLKGEAGAVMRFFNEFFEVLGERYSLETMTFPELVAAEFASRINHDGDAMSLLTRMGAQKVWPETAAEFAWQCAERGAALGAVKPDLVNGMFIRTHSTVDDSTWQRAREARLDIPPVQDVPEYAQVEKDENALFMEYCRECCPEYYTILSSSTSET